MTRKEQINSAYKQLGSSANFYDGMITYSTLPGKAVCRLVWNMDGGKNLEYLTRALSGVPEGFFTPPFETEDSLRERLAGMYEEVSVSSVEGMGCFRCRKA